MKAALIRSANDAAVAVAETVGGSYDGCVRMINAQSRQPWHDRHATETVDGLPPTPGHDVDVTNALDLATLARALVHTTNLLAWSGMETAPFDGGIAMLHNTNHLVGHFEGCDGLKTGFTMQAGFNLTATAKRGDMRLISVVLGTPSNWARFSQSATLLSWGFDNFAKVELLKRGEPLPVRVQVQQGPIIQPISENAIALVLPKSEIPGLKLQYSAPRGCRTSCTWYNPRFCNCDGRRRNHRALRRDFAFSRNPATCYTHAGRQRRGRSQLITTPLRSTRIRRPDEPRIS